MTKREAIYLFGSVTQLANALGIRPQAVSQWEEGPLDDPRASQVTLRAIEQGLLKMKVVTHSPNPQQARGRGRPRSSSREYVGVR
jgi:transcriptional regulator with XRE-family HTH domain